MRRLPVLLFLLAACGRSTDTTATTAARYNFKVVDGRNQTSTAGSGQLAKPITSQLARNPQGEFSWVDLLLPTKAYAQGITVAGEPVAGAIVCGREANAGEPQVIPLCAFTLADGKAANSVKPGTKAGTFTLLFTAQITSQQPVQDSTTVVVTPGAPAKAGGSQPCSTGQPGCYLVSGGDAIDLHYHVSWVQDQYDNPLDISTLTPGYAVRAGAYNPASPTTPDATGWTVVIDPKFAAPATYAYPGAPAVYGQITVYFWFGTARGAFPMEVK